MERSRLLMKHFADIEQMRRRSETNRRVYSAREKMQETEEEVKVKILRMIYCVVLVIVLILVLLCFVY